MTSIIELLMVAFAIFYFTPTLFQRLVGPRCPTCKRGRLRRTGSTQILPTGAMDTWVCRQCGAAFCQANLDALKNQRVG